MDHLMAGIEDIVGKTGNYNVRDKFKRFDNKFIRPLLLRDVKVSYILKNNIFHLIYHLQKEIYEQKIINKVDYKKKAINDIEKELNTRRSSSKRGSRNSEGTFYSAQSRSSRSSRESESRPITIKEDDEEQIDEEGL